jgi:hypothetical protein
MRFAAVPPPHCIRTISSEFNMERICLYFKIPGCQTADEDCLPMNSVNFPCNLAGQRYPGCKCELDFDNSIIYSLYGCLTDEGTFVALDDMHTKDCTEYKCTKIDDQFLLEPVMTGIKCGQSFGHSALGTFPVPGAVKCTQ